MVVGVGVEGWIGKKCPGRSQEIGCSTGREGQSRPGQ